MDSPDVQSIHLKGHTDFIRSAAFSPVEELLASASHDQTVRLWNSISGEQVATLTGHTSWAASVSFSPDGATLASGAGDSTIKLWDVESRTEIITLTTDGDIYSVSFSPDGTLLASGSSDHTTRLWDIKSKTCIRIMKSPVTSWVRSVAFSPDGKTVASGSDDCRAYLWDVRSGAHRATLRAHAGGIHSIAFSPAGDQLATASYDDSVNLWSTASNALVETLSIDGQSNRSYGVAYSPSGQFIASGRGDNAVHLWDVVSRSHHSMLEGHGALVSHVAFSPDGFQLASASADNTIRLWNLPDELIARTRPLFDQNDVNDQDDASSEPDAFDFKNDVTSLISFEDMVHIGLGGFGDVFSATHKDSGKVALKRPHKFFDEAAARRFLREVDLWCSVTHRYVLPYLGMCKSGPYVYVVSPFIENGDIHSCVSKGISFNPTKILYEVAEALAHLHHIGIVHGDIKAQNVLISINKSALLCDFGLAKVLDSTVTSTESKGTGSVRWMAPELLQDGSRSMASDVYSFGITIAEVLSGQAPYPDITDNLTVMFNVVFSGKRPPKEPLASPEGKSYSILWDAAEKCWGKEDKDRPYMAQVLGMLFPLAQEKN